MSQTPSRRPVLKGAIATDFEGITREVCDTHGWEILELAIQPEHVHLFVGVWPKDSAAEVVGKIKGRTSHHLRKKYPELLKLPSLWSSSFFASTAGSVSAETIKKYIEAQKGG